LQLLPALHPRLPAPAGPHPLPQCAQVHGTPGWAPRMRRWVGRIRGCRDASCFERIWAIDYGFSAAHSSANRLPCPTPHPIPHAETVAARAVTKRAEERSQEEAAPKAAANAA